MSSRQAEFPAGGPIASQLVGDPLPRRSPLSLQELAEKALSSSRVPAARDQNIQDVAVLVHRPPEIAALPADRDEDLIHMLDIAQPAMPTAQVPSKGGTEFATPHSDRLVGDCDTALGEKVFDIPEAEGEPMIEPHSVTDDLGWEAVTSIQGFHRSGVPHGRQLDNTCPVVLSGELLRCVQPIPADLCRQLQQKSYCKPRFPPQLSPRIDHPWLHRHEHVLIQSHRPQVR